MKVLLATLFIALAFVACTKKEEVPSTPPAAVAPVTEAPATAPATAPAPDANTAPAAPVTDPAPTGK